MPVLKGLTIALTGDIKDSSTPPRTIPLEQLKRWIHANGGIYTPRVTRETTHLVASKEAFKRGDGAVTAARSLPTPIPIVTFAWLEDSLLKRRKLAETKYTWEVEREQRRRRKMVKRLGPRADRLKFERGCEDAVGTLGSGELMDKDKEMVGKKEMGFFKSALGSLEGRRVAREAELAARMAEKTGRAECSAGDVTGMRSGYLSVARSGAPQRKTRLGTAAPRVHAGVTPSTKPDTPVGTHPSTPSTTTSTFPPSSTPSLLPASSFPPSTSQQTNPPANAKLQDLYHIYIDATGFEYKLLLLRHHHQHNTFARYDLRLYESHSLPHVYCTLVRYTPPALPLSLPTTSTTTTFTPPTSSPTVTTAPRPNRHLLTPPSSPFAPSFTAFRHAFRDLTLLSWHERFETEVQRVRARAFGVEPYVWRAPGRGLPTGVMPGVGYVEGGWVWNRWGLEVGRLGGEEEKYLREDNMVGKECGRGKGEEREERKEGKREEGKRKEDGKKVVGKGKGGGKGGRF